jgi:hypothetical protein
MQASNELLRTGARQPDAEVAPPCRLLPSLDIETLCLYFTNVSMLGL